NKPKNIPKPIAPGPTTVTVFRSLVAQDVNVAVTDLTSGLSYAATTTARAGMTYRWTVGNATITSPSGAAGAAITFAAGTAGVPLTLAVAETNAAGDSATSNTTSLTVWVPAIACSITAPAHVSAGSSLPASSPR